MSVLRMTFVTRNISTGLFLGLVAVLGCQVQPTTAPVVTTEQAAPEQPGAAETTPKPVQKSEKVPAYVDRFVPPSLGKMFPLPPKSEIRTLAGDLGILRPGTSAEYKFAITNDAKIDWSVRVVIPDCNCSVGEFTQKVIKPGETSHLVVTQRVDQRDGPVVSSLAVNFWEAEAPKYLLYLRSEVRRPLVVVPNLVDLGRVGPVEQLARSVEVRNYSEKDIVQPTCDAPSWLQVKLTLVEKPAEDNRARQTWRADIQADLAKLPADAAPGQLLIRGGGPPESVAVPVQLTRKAPLEPAPAEVVFDKFTPGQVHERSFLLETYPDLKALSPKDLILTHNLGDEFTAEVVKQLTPHRFQVRTRYHPRAAWASVEGELTVSVRERDLPPARVKVKGTR